MDTVVHMKLLPHFEKVHMEFLRNMINFKWILLFINGLKVEFFEKKID